MVIDRMQTNWMDLVAVYLGQFGSGSATVSAVIEFRQNAVLIPHRGFNLAIDIMYTFAFEQTDKRNTLVACEHKHICVWNTQENG